MGTISLTEVGNIYTAGVHVKKLMPLHVFTNNLVWKEYIGLYNETICYTRGQSVKEGDNFYECNIVEVTGLLPSNNRWCWDIATVIE